jgi:hypothetical protein
MAVPVCLFLVLQEPTGMELFAPHLIATAQLELIGKDLPVLPLPISALLEPYGTA